MMQFLSRQLPTAASLAAASTRTHSTRAAVTALQRIAHHRGAPAAGAFTNALCAAPPATFLRHFASGSTSRSSLEEQEDEKEALKENDRINAEQDEEAEFVDKHQLDSAEAVDPAEAVMDEAEVSEEYTPENDEGVEEAPDGSPINADGEPLLLDGEGRIVYDENGQPVVDETKERWTDAKLKQWYEEHPVDEDPEFDSDEIDSDADAMNAAQRAMAEEYMKLTVEEREAMTDEEREEAEEAVAVLRQHELAARETKDLAAAMERIVGYDDKGEPLTKAQSLTYEGTIYDAFGNPEDSKAAELRREAADIVIYDQETGEVDALATAKAREKYLDEAEPHHVDEEEEAENPWLHDEEWYDELLPDEPHPLVAHKPRRRKQGEDFPGMLVEVRSNIPEHIRKAMAEHARDNSIHADEKRVLENEDPEVQAEREKEKRRQLDPTNPDAQDLESTPPSYNEEHDPYHGYTTEQEHLTEIVYAFDSYQNRMVAYPVGGEEVPLTTWPHVRMPQVSEKDLARAKEKAIAAIPRPNPETDEDLKDDPDGKKLEAKERAYHQAVQEAYAKLDEELGREMPPPKQWLTWKRSWENIRKYGEVPADHEVTEHLIEILGLPKPQGLKQHPDIVHANDELFFPVKTEALLPRQYSDADKAGENIGKDWKPLEDDLDQNENKEDSVARLEALDKGVPLSEVFKKDASNEASSITPFTGRVRPGLVRYDRIETRPYQLLKTESEWVSYVGTGQKPKSYFEEARRLYRKKLHLVRVKYLAEYRRVKALHDANIRARWAQHEQQRLEKAEDKRQRQVVTRARAEADYDRWAERRARIRAKSRVTRQNKEMKRRRHEIHMFNYILKERERHWLQPTVKHVPGQKKPDYFPSRHMNVKLFEKQEAPVGFWPKPADQDFHERKEEENRRKSIKELA